MSQKELTCKPLDSIEELYQILEDPPPWRSLCRGLKQHSSLAINNFSFNVNVNKSSGNNLESPQSFCHFDTDIDVERVNKKSLPKTLVCHDMANGYHEDSFVDGTGRHDAYTFCNWAGVDIFCYFSHHLLTVPPLSWINVGHQHGVKVIGTLITEHEAMVEWWERLLGEESGWRRFAAGLVALAKMFSFDGWLLNIENRIKSPAKLLEFVRYLHALLHEELPAAELIWYDSVTVHGNLLWQNGLTQENIAFFEACDGLFTNYSWSERLVASSAALAGPRLTDLYVGIDVWGRNFYGGGKFNTQAKEIPWNFPQAVKIAHKYGCSVAIFAPAWTHEAMPADSHPSLAELDRNAQFLLRERALWGSLWPYLHTNLPCHLPFHTSFCRGQGKKRWMYGEVIGPVPWYNFRHMQYQPNSNHGPHGYLLSSVGNILKVTTHETLRDETISARYRELFHNVMSQSKLDVDAEDDNDLQPLEVGPEIPKRAKRSSKNVVSPKDDPGIHHQVVRLSRDLTSVMVTNSERSSSKQQQQRSEHDKRLILAEVPGERECLEVYYQDAFNGGSCLKINPSDDVSQDTRTIRLLHCDFNVETDLVVCVVTKRLAEAPEQFLNLELIVFQSDENNRRVILVGHDIAVNSRARPDEDVEELFSINSTPMFSQVQRYLLLNEPGFYVPTENSYGWHVKYYLVDGPGCVKAIYCRAGVDGGSVLLGHVGLCHYKLT